MATKSRYDFMEAGSVMDEESNSLYPDPLTLNYLNLEMTEDPTKLVMTNARIAFFWKTTEDVYDTPYYDDIVLTLNGVPHKNFLEQQDVIYFPTLSDIKTSFMKDRG